MRKLKTGDPIIITGDCSIYGCPTNLRILRDDKVYAHITGGHLDNTSEDAAINIEFSKSTGISTLVTHHNVARKDLRLISSKKELEERIQLAKVFSEKYLEKKQSIIDELEKDPKITNSTRTFEIANNNPLKLQTNLNFAILGNWDKKTNTFSHSPDNKHYLAHCCAFTKQSRDIAIFIPKIWLNYHQYSRNALVRWLDFIKKMEIDFDYHFAESVANPEELNSNKINSSGETYKDQKYRLVVSLNGQLENSLIYPCMGEFYKLFINGSAYHMHTYMRFILVRYMYNNNYWQIPGLAMQIKFHLKSKVTHWEAMLMAHLFKDYTGSWGLINSSGNFVDVFNPSNRVDSILDRLKITYNMNSSFSYTTKYSRGTINDFFAKKDYEGLLKYLKS